MARSPHELKPARKIGPVLAALGKRYGPTVRTACEDPLVVLVHGILSQNTTDLNSGRAFENLMCTFGSWEAMAQADLKDIAAAIQVGGLADQKAVTIKSVLRWVGRQPGGSLDFLRGMSDAEAEETLTAIKGVGIKTARLVLLFGLGRPVFVVDTHVLRVSKRLGLISPDCSREKAHRLLDTLVPDEAKYSGHLEMISHGRQTCTARSPACPSCVVGDWCLYVRGLL